MSDGDIREAAQSGAGDGAAGGAAREEITRQVTEFLTAALRKPVQPDDDYFALGLADSLFALELVTFVESRFSLTVEVEDLDLDSFRTANRITRFVLRKTGSPEFTETQ